MTPAGKALDDSLGTL